MKETKPDVKKEAYEKPEVFKEGSLRDITAGDITASD
jgi:hypothetical protein